MSTDLYTAKHYYEIARLTLDRIRDEGVPDSIPNLWDAVVDALDRAVASLRQWRESGHNYTDGLYKLGSQRTIHGPPHALAAVQRFHDELDRVRAKRRSKG